MTVREMNSKIAEKHDISESTENTLPLKALFYLSLYHGSCNLSIESGGYIWVCHLWVLAKNRAAGPIFVILLDL